MKLRKLSSATLLSLILVWSADASIVTLSASRTGPRMYTSGGESVDGGLVRIGTFIGAPASNSIDDISLAFEEFGESRTGIGGRLGTTVSSFDGTPFNGQQIYVWVFNTDSIVTASEHAIFTNLSSAPSGGDQWIFPTHTGTGTDAVVVVLRDLYDVGDDSFTPGVQFLGSADRIVLTPIPEPSASILVACVAAGMFIRRRR